MITNEKTSNSQEHEIINFTEIFDIEEIQKLQDLFADTHGVASIITYPDGKPITKPSNFCRLCNDVIRKTEKGIANCIKSDAEIGCFNPKGAIIKKCLSVGLWDAVACITAENKQIANWLIGQVRNEETDFNAIMQYADEIGANRKIFAEAYKEVPEMSSEKFKKIANLLYAFANELSDKAYKNLLLKKQIKEIENTKHELIKAKEKAEINEKEIKLLIESQAEGISFVNQDEIFEFANSASEKIFETETGELFGKSLYDFLDNTEISIINNQIKNRRNGNTDNYNLKIITKKNNIKYINVTATPKFDKNNNYLGAYGIFRDITEQTLIEFELEENKEKYRGLSEAAFESIFISEKGICIEQNKTAEKTFGYTTQEALGRYGTDWIIPEDREKVMNHMINGYEEPYEATALKKDGTTFPCLLSGKMMFYKGKKVRVTSLTDITSLKQAQKELTENEKQKAAILKALPDLLFEFNKNGDYLAAYTEDDSKLIIPKNEIIGKNISAFFDEEMVGKIKAAFNNSLNKKELITLTYSMVFDNKNYYYEARIIPSSEEKLLTIVRDVTNQKIAKEALKVNEEKYRLLAENVTDIIWTMNITGKYQYISPSVLNMLGYKPEEFINKTFGELLTKESEIIAKNYFIETSELILSGYKPESKNLTLEIFKSDGNPIWTEINITAIFEKNEFKYFLGVTRNINERKKAEENTIKIKKYYQAIIENAPDGVALINDNGAFKYISPSAKKMFGFDINEELNINPNEYTHPDDLEFVITNLTKLINDSSFIPTLQYRFLDKNGNWKWIETTMRNLLTDENVQAIVLNFRDINDRKIIEQELNQAKETYYDIFNSVSEAIYIQDENGTFIDINKGAEKIYGYSREELIGKSPLDVVAPDFNDINETQKLSFEVLKTGIPQRFDFWAVKKNGEIFPKEVIVNKGKYFGKEVLIATARDMTEQKNAEEKIRNSEEKYRFIAENTSDGIVTFNHLSQITYVSPSYLNQIGYSEEEELNRNKESIYELIHPEDREITYANIFEAINLKKTNLTYSYRVKHKDGHYIWREDNATFKYDENMQYAGANVICRDITKRIQTELITKAQYKIANLLLTSKNLEELLETIQIELKSIINVNNFYVAIYDKKTDLLSAPFVSDIIDKNRKWKAEKSFTGIVIKNNQTLLINTEKEFEDYYYKGEAILLGKQAKTWLGVPLNINNEVIGAIVIQDYEKEYAYTEKEVEILQFISNQISIAIKRKKDEQQIRLLAKSIEQSPVSIVITNNEGIIEYVNSKFSEISNYSSEEIIGKNVNILKSGKQNSDVYKNLWDTISNGNQWFGELHNKKKNGEFYWESVNISPVVDENANITHYVAIKEDITERKNIYEELIHSKKQIEESENFINSIATETIDIIYIFDIKTEKNIYINKNLRDLLGYQSGEVPEDSMELINLLIHPEDKKNFYYIETLQNWTKEYINYYEYRLKDALGEWRWFSGREKEFQHLNGKITSIIGIVTDITEKKKQESELIHAKEKAEESDKLKTAFLHNISHEIRTPFNGILGFLQFVGDDDITQEERREYINIINRSSMRLINTINDIVDISQIQAGQAKLYLSEVNIPKTLAELHEFFFAFAEIKNLDLAIQNTNNLNIIKTDYNKLKAIFSFLIDNAIKFTKTGKVEFGIAQHNQLPDFINVKDKYTYFFVKDTGVGIPKDKQAIIFDKFMQADVSDTRGYEGSGLGLSIAMAYTQILGGDIFLESEVGKGSIFYFSISREPLNIDNKTITLNSNYQNRKKTKLNIIIAEDDENSEIFIRTMIKSISNNLYVARTGRECIELCKNNADTDLILMDIKMPDMNGDEACKEIRKFNNDVIIIAQTAFAFNSDKLNAIQAGCNDFIAKPLNKNNFFSLIYKYFTINNL